MTQPFRLFATFALMIVLIAAAACSPTNEEIREMVRREVARADQETPGGTGPQNRRTVQDLFRCSRCKSSGS